MVNLHKYITVYLYHLEKNKLNTTFTGWYKKINFEKKIKIAD